jgi:hypothetical protein
VNGPGVLAARARLLGHRLFGPPGRGRARHPFLAFAITVTLAALVFVGAVSLFTELGAGGADAGTGAGLLAVALTITFVGLLVFDVHEAVGVLVLDSDLELLRRAPLAPLQVLAIKLADVVPRTLGLVVVVAIPALVAWAATWPLPRWGVALAAGELALLWAIPMSLGLAVSLELLCHAPPQRTREAITALATLTLTLLWIANAFLLPRVVDPRQALAARLRTRLAAPGARTLLPPAWMARSLARAAAHDAKGALAAAVPLAAAAAASAALAGGVAALRLDEAQARAAAGGAARRRRRRLLPAATPEATAWDGASRAAMGGPLRGWRMRVIGATLRRDLRLYARDWTVLGDVVTAAALWTLLPLVGAPLYPAAPARLTRIMLLALTVGLGYEVAARSVPFERRGLAWCRLAPVTSGAWLAGKYAAAAAISLVLLALAVVALALAFPLPLATWGATLSLVIPALAVSLALGLWTGAAFGDPAWTNPRAMLDLTGRLLASGLLLAQATAWALLAETAAWRGHGLPGWVWVGVPAAVAAVATWVPMRAASARLGNQEWS